MRLLLSPHDPLPFKGPFELSIGNFDGVHLGHQNLIRRMKEKNPAVILTFSNHPTEIFTGSPPPLITSLAHRLQLFEEMGIDATILIPFTKELSEKTAEQFLHSLHEKLPFTRLLLGPNATLGCRREGTPAVIHSIAQKEKFAVEYLPFVESNGIKVSSSHIRACIQQGDLKQASLLLGRPYSITGAIEKGSGRGKKWGFPTANLQVPGLCLPPLGVYVVELMVQGVTHRAVANLGYAPTVRESSSPSLEVHALDIDLNVYGQSVEVTFMHHLRSEKRFSSIEELKAQIHQDIEEARSYFNLTLV